MKFDSFADFDRYGDELYAKGKINEVLELFLKASEVLPKEDYEAEYFLITSYIASLYRKTGRMDEFYDVVMNLINKGYACGNWIIKALLEMEREGLSELLEKNRLLLEEAQRNAEMKYTVCLPNGYTNEQKYPVFFALHGDGADGNIHTFSLYWTPEAFEDQGFITIYVQSSQVYCHGGYQWNKDVEIAGKDIMDCFREVSERYSIDSSQMYVGGFSGGAMISVKYTLDQVIPFKGFISFCPGSLNDYFSLEQAQVAAEHGVRGVILEGELELEPSVQDMIKVFDETGVQYKYVINEGVGHICPKDLTEKLEDAMAFFLEL